MPLQGLYLGQGLAQMAAQMQDALVVTTYVTDKNGVIAKADARGHFQVPPETRNATDWRLTQELIAQADALISGGDYMRGVAAHGGQAQDILHQFEPGREFEELGEWRLRTGYRSRSPDLAVVAHRVDFRIPEDIRRSGRRVAVFTTNGVSISEEAKALARAGTPVVGAGESGVDGNRMIDYLRDETGASVIVMASGPHVLQLLLAAKRLNLLYITQVQREIPFGDPSRVKTLLPDGKRVQDLEEFQLTHEYVQDDAVTADGSAVSQFFLRYDRK